MVNATPFHAVLTGDLVRSQEQRTSTDSISVPIRVALSEIAQHWQPEPITQQAVSKHLRQAAWTRLYATLDRFERFVRHLPTVSLPSS